MNYNSKMLISNFCKSDILWWQTNVSRTFNDIRSDSFHREIFSDASLTGWGACCGPERTHGFWSESQKLRHINYLELQAISYGILCYARELRDCNILLRCDNTTAISYINRMGSIQFPELSLLSKKIWQWCEERNIWLFASYISSKENTNADIESRNFSPETEWSLLGPAFDLLEKTFGKPEIDLFASQINNKCEKYISWFKDPNAANVDAFTVSWNSEFFYAFPPFALILRTLQKIIQDRAEGILVVPCWPSQPWYPLFQKLIFDKEVYLEPSPDLLSSPFFRSHPLARNLTLVGAKLSGKRFCLKMSQTRQ